MLAANLLPALHANEHISPFELEKAEHISTPGVGCDLCDFTFSSSGEPFIFSFDLYPPQYYFTKDISTPETVHLFPKRIFSLRAPPEALS